MCQPSPVVPDDSSLLTAEMSELNNWTRTWITVYATWYVMTFTVNSLAIGWLFAYHDSVVSVIQWARSVFTLIAFWDLLGAAGAWKIREFYIYSDDRISSILGLLSTNKVRGAKSPLPRKAATLVYALTALSILVYAAAWVALAIHPSFLGSGNSQPKPSCG
jgi:hypothetical protein